MIEYAIGFYLGGAFATFFNMVTRWIVGKECYWWTPLLVVCWPVLTVVIPPYSLYKLWLGYEYDCGEFILAAEADDA